MNEQQEKLNSMLDSGKITPEQFQELQANMPQKPIMDYIKEQKPWQVWVCSVFLFAAAVLIPAYDKHPYMLIASILNTGLGIGLLFRKRWAFIASAIFGGLAVLSVFVQMNLLAFLINVSFCIILGSAWQYYFKQK
ncbi:MAG: hypothetical protein ACE14V_12030 [bacterium]